MQLRRGKAFGLECRVLEKANDGKVLAQDVREQRHEKVVKGLEAPAECDGFGHRHVRLNLEMLRGESPGWAPIGPEPICFGDRQPSRLLLALFKWGRKLAAVEMRHPIGGHPTEGRMVDVALLELTHRKWCGPTPAVRDISQKPPGFFVIGVALEDRTQADACKRVLRRFGVSGFPGDIEKGRGSAVGGSLATADGNTPGRKDLRRLNDFGKRHESCRPIGQRTSGKLGPYEVGRVRLSLRAIVSASVVSSADSRER